MNSHEQLYEKLNNVHASLRKEKEDAYRTKQLAEQRLQLARQDREAAEKKWNETRAQLRQLKERAAEMKKSNAAVEAENKQMEKEVRLCSFEWCSMMCKSCRFEFGYQCGISPRCANGIIPFISRLRPCLNPVQLPTLGTPEQEGETLPPRGQARDRGKRSSLLRHRRPRDASSASRGFVEE